MVTHPENRTGIDRLRGFVRDLIGPGRPYASARDMADSLHLADGRATILYKFLKGAEPRAGVVLDWLEHLGITVIYPEDCPEDCPEDSPEDGTDEDPEFLPVMNRKPSTGPDAVPSCGDTQHKTIQGLPASLFRNLGLNPDICHVMPITGDSMEPVIADNSLVIVEALSQHFFFLESDKLYVLRYHGEIVARRVVFEPDRTTLLPCNKTCKPIVIIMDSTEDFELLGRIRWILSSI